MRPEPTLIELTNYTRFRPTTRYQCPQCSSAMLEDHWPPNYGGGSIGQGRAESKGSVKCICLGCQITFIAHWWAILERGQTDEGYRISTIVPLLERDGKLLTPHDVWRYQYYDEHGEWPVEVYG